MKKRNTLQNMLKVRYIDQKKVYMSEQSNKTFNLTITGDLDEHDHTLKCLVESERLYDILEAIKDDISTLVDRDFSEVDLRSDLLELADKIHASIWELDCYGNIIY